METPRWLQADIVWQLVESMPALGVEPNIVNYNTAIRAICRAGDFSRANQVFALMAARKVQPEFTTYRAAINGSCEAGAIDVAVNYLDQLKANGFTPDLSIQVSSELSLPLDSREQRLLCARRQSPAAMHPPCVLRISLAISPCAAACSALDLRRGRAPVPRELVGSEYGARAAHGMARSVAS